MAGRRGFSGVKPPSDGRSSPRAHSRRRRLVRMAPPANDNRSQGIKLGRLQFTGFRIAVAALIVASMLAIAYGLRLI